MDKKLELVGATWMTVSPDSYVAFSFVQSGWDEYESYYCSDVEGWKPNQTCTLLPPANGVTKVMFPVLSVCLFVILSFHVWPALPAGRRLAID